MFGNSSLTSFAATALVNATETVSPSLRGSPTSELPAWESTNLAFGIACGVVLTLFAVGAVIGCCRDKKIKCSDLFEFHGSYTEYSTKGLRLP